MYPSFLAFSVLLLRFSSSSNLQTFFLLKFGIYKRCYNKASILRLTRYAHLGCSKMTSTFIRRGLTRIQATYCYNHVWQTIKFLGRVLTLRSIWDAFQWLEMSKNLTTGRRSSGGSGEIRQPSARDLLRQAQLKHKIFEDEFVIKSFYESEKAHHGHVCLNMIEHRETQGLQTMS